MIPKSLSATSLQTWESCPARWVATSHKKAPEMSGVYADLGSSVHGALEDFVRDAYVTKSADADLSLDGLMKLLDPHFESYFGVLDGEFYEDARRMLSNWYESRFAGLADREILALETKDCFTIQTSAGEIKCNYIFDRLDRHPDGSIEVVDYKSIRARLQPEGLRDKIQARFYAVAAQILYPDAPRVWVTFDLLRYDPVGIVFSREENLATWRYIKRKAEEIIATPEADAPEKINPDCRFCIRKQACETLREHVEVGGVLALEDPIEAARTRALLDHRLKALTASIEELDKYILQQAEHDDTDVYEDDGISVEIFSRRTRTVKDPARVIEILGPERVKRYAGMTLANLDRVLKNEELTDAERSELESMVGYKSGNPSIRVKLDNPIDV